MSSASQKLSATRTTQSVALRHVHQEPSLERATAEQHAIEHVAPVDEPDLDPLLSPSEPYERLDEQTRLAVAGAGAHRRAARDLGFDRNARLWVVLAQPDVEAHPASP